MRTLINDGSTVPTAFVTKGRQRVKQYNDTVYLNNGDEFELELFNPTTNKVLAKIELNGVSLGSGIVLRPGERVFLERYLNESRKFLFETYEVDGSDLNVQKAIEYNGNVDVKFYSETINFYWSNSWTWTGSPTITYTTGTPPNLYGSFNNTSDSVNCFYSQSNSQVSGNDSGFAGASGVVGDSTPQSKLKPIIETGRVEKGSNSNQSFKYDNSSFNSWWTWSSSWKILPASYKPFESKDLKVFCTNCGTKQKKSSHKFCPNCGTKY